MAITIEEVIALRFKKVIQCFNEVIENGKTSYVCQVNNCSNTYQSASASIRHVRIHHKEFHNTIQQNNLDTSIDTDLNKMMEIRVKVNPVEIWNACIDLVTVNALPLSFVEFPAFKTILQPYIISLRRQGVELVITRKNIKQKIEERAQSIKNIISSEVKNKMCSVMIDIASRYNRSILGVSISYFFNRKVRIRTIAMHVLKSAHTAEQIKDMIIKNLREYNIRLEQVLAVTSDNGKNMLKSIALINEAFEQPTDSEEYIDHNVLDDEYYENLLSEVRAMFTETNYTSLIHGISCGAHCLHLIVTHAIKNSTETVKLIGKCRELAKKLRCPTFRAILNSVGSSMAILDVSTRWNSIFSMLNRLLDLQSFCDSDIVRHNRQINRLLLSESEWEEVQALVMVLSPFNKHTKSLQSEKTTLSDFFGYWTMMRIKLAKASDELSQKMLIEMNKYHEMLMDNPAIVAAIYLDPRYQRGLKDKKPLAIQFLVNLYQRMQKVENFVDSEERAEAIESDHNTAETNDSDSFDDMNRYLDACNSIEPQNNVNSNTFNENNESLITNLLKQFDGVSEQLKSTIWEIWERKKQTDPELYNLAMTVFSIPPTQTTVERSFSALAIVLNSHRTRLADNSLENILLVRLNQDVYGGEK